MNAQKLTQKSIEAINAAQSAARENQNPQVTQMHMLYAFLSDDNGLISQILKTLTNSDVKEAVVNEINKLPRVSGGMLYISPELETSFDTAEKQAEKMKDEYISVEHLFIGILEQPCPESKKIFESCGIKKDAFMKALAQIRGSSRVTGTNPEDTYDVLKKYGSDLVELARNKKLDPVIGRDNEIRNVIRILSRKTKNNPVLIGEPGVGKTAIADSHCVLYAEMSPRV